MQYENDLEQDRDRRRHADEPALPDLTPERALAKRWEKSVRTLQRWRNLDQGPAFIRIGGSVFYRQEDILAFEDAARCGGGQA